MFSISYDAKIGLIRCRCDRAFSVLEVQREAAMAKRLIARCRAEHGDVKALVVIDSESRTPP